MVSANSESYRGKRVIVVEDDIPSAKYYETMLRKTGASVKLFRNGREFVSHIEKEGAIDADIVIMDYLIPVINGVDCTRISRKYSKSVPVIMISAFVSEEIKREAYIAGCNEYILKPLFPENFLLVLEKYLLQRSPAYTR